MKREDYEERTVMAELALALAEKKHGPEDHRLLKPLNHLGRLYMLQGRRLEAIPLMQRALAIADRLGQGGSKAVAMLVNNLAVGLSMEGRIHESIPLFERSLALRETIYGPAHPELATLLVNFGAACVSLNELDRGQALLTRALDIAEKGRIDPADHFWVRLYINLSAVHQHRKEFDSAKEYLERILGLKALKLGDTMQAVVYNNLGRIAMEQGRRAEAANLLQIALEAKERQLGYDNAEVVPNLINLADLYLDMGDLDKADTTFLRAIRIGEARLSPNHHLMAMAYHRYGYCLLARGYYQTAGEYFDKALEITLGTLGPEHPEVAGINQGLGDLALAEGDSEDALTHYGRALEMLRKCRAPESKEVLELVKKMEQARGKGSNA